MQAVVRMLTPPACREHVLGDLCERYRSRRQYAFEALTTIPFVVTSRIRRTSSPGLLTMQVSCVCVGFWNGTPLSSLEMGTAAVGALIMLLARDVYRGRVQAWPRTAAGDALAAVSGAVVAQGVLALAGPSSFDAVIALWTGLGAFVLIFVSQVLMARAAWMPPIRDRIWFVLVALVWSAVFAFAAVAAVGAASGLLFGAMAARGMNPAADHTLISSIGRIWVVTPVVAGAIALALCIVCRLPGTGVAARRSHAAL